MDRRRFLQLLGLGVGGVAIEQAIPLGRVWSFPKEIVMAKRFVGADLAYGPDLNAVYFMDSRGYAWRWAGELKPIRVSYIPNPESFSYVMKIPVARVSTPSTPSEN